MSPARSLCWVLQGRRRGLELAFQNAAAQESAPVRTGPGDGTKVRIGITTDERADALRTISRDRQFFRFGGDLPTGPAYGRGSAAWEPPGDAYVRDRRARSVRKHRSVSTSYVDRADCRQSGCDVGLRPFV